VLATADELAAKAAASARQPRPNQRQAPPIAEGTRLAFVSAMGHPASGHGRSAHHEVRRDGYSRRRPEQTAFYQTVAEHWPAFRERAEEAGGLPKFIVQEFEDYLHCGRLEAGCLHLVCRRCGHSQLVALSCKRRGFCCACLGRRMSDTAVHLVNDVLPAVPIRHWICTLPWGLRALLGYDRVLCSEVVRAFMGELTRSLRRRAKRVFGLASVAHAHTGAVAAVHRTDSAIRLNVHAHVLALDGVYVRDGADGPLTFHALPTPTAAEVADVARRCATRIEGLLRKHGRSLDPELVDDQPLELELDQPALSACYAAAARGVGVTGDGTGQPTLRLIFPDAPHRALAPGQTDEPVAEVRGINLHAKQVVDGRDRNSTERLCRYITRPPFAQHRFSRRADGLLQLELKRVSKDGTHSLVFEPQELIARLVAAVPAPRFHQLRYFGLLASHSALRSEVVPQHPHDDCAHRPPPAAGDQLELLGESNDGSPKGLRHRWAWLLAHVFLADLEHCPKCQGPMRWAEVASTPKAASRLMAKHGLAPQPPSMRQQAPLEQLRLPFDT
jgi:hypothetical protein